METESRTVTYDGALGIEAYHFKGIMQKFPNHFHEHYVIGFVESGRRFLTCKNKHYTVTAGDLLLFNPLDSHACEQIDGEPLDWRCLNIKPEVMRKVAKEITGAVKAPVFTTNVAAQSDAVLLLRELHSGIMMESEDFGKEERFYFLMAQLISEYTNPRTTPDVRADTEIQSACDYMETHYIQSVSLADVSKAAGLNKHTLLRNFTLQKGITPYQYLSTIRINRAKKLLEGGTPVLEAAMQCGFSDQSHFTRFFKTFIGLTPKLYQNLFQSDFSE